VKRTLTVWAFGAITGVVLTYELLWNEATAALAREYHHLKGHA